MSKYWYFLDGMLSVFSFPISSGFPEKSKPFNLVDDFKEFPLSDAEAIASDWKTVGNDMRKAFVQFEEKRISQV
jgi:hypothetical protein